MKDFVGSYAERTYRGRDTLGKLLKLDLELPSRAGRAREEDLHRLGYASLEPWGTGDPEMIGTTRELPIENEEWKPTKVIPVEVTDNDRTNIVGIDTRSLERDER